MTNTHSAMRPSWVDSCSTLENQVQRAQQNSQNRQQRQCAEHAAQAGLILHAVPRAA